MKKIINPWRNHPEYRSAMPLRSKNCFGCCPENPIGLHMEFYEDGDYIVSKWHPEKNYQGWVNTMHGGIKEPLIYIPFSVEFLSIAVLCPSRWMNSRAEAFR